jgi:hypothetical protein
MGLAACTSDKIPKKSADFGSVTCRQALPGPVRWPGKPLRDEVNGGRQSVLRPVSFRLRMPPSSFKRLRCQYVGFGTAKDQRLPMGQSSEARGTISFCA